MDSAIWAKMISVFLLSSVKLLFAPGAGIAAGLSFGQTAILSSSGGCCGVLFFYHSGHWLTETIRNYLDRRRKSEERIQKKRKVFTRRNRLVVQIKEGYGMIGLALLTPAIISIPLGSVVAARFYWSNKWMLPLLLLSTVGWSVVLTVVATGIRHKFMVW